MSARVAMGFAGSIGMARVSFRKGFTHQRVAMVESMAKTGSLSSSDRAMPASRKLTWFSATIGLGPALATLSKPVISIL